MWRLCTVNGWLCGVIGAEDLKQPSVQSERSNAMNNTSASDNSDLDERSELVTFTSEVSDEELEAMAGPVCCMATLTPCATNPAWCPTYDVC